MLSSSPTISKDELLVCPLSFPRGKRKLVTYKDSQHNQDIIGDIVAECNISMADNSTMMEHIVHSLIDSNCLALFREEQLYLIHRKPTSAIQGVFVPLASCYSPRCSPQQLCYAPSCPNKGDNLRFSLHEKHIMVVSAGYK